MFFVHFVENLQPHPVVDTSFLNTIKHALDVTLTLKRVLVLEHHLHEVDKGLLDVRLNKTEVLITLVLQNLCKQRNIMLFLDVGFHSVDYSRSPLYDQGLQPVLLIKICVHKLFECFLGHLVILALFVEFYLLGIHILNRVLQLLKRQNASLGAPNGPRALILNNGGVVDRVFGSGALG